VYEQGVVWVTSTPEPVGAVRSAKQYLTYVPTGPFQYAVAEAPARPGDPARPDGYHTSLRDDLRRDLSDDLRDDLRAQRDPLSQRLSDAVSGALRAPAPGTYFVTTDIRPLGERPDIGFCLALPECRGVGAVPTQVFYDHEAAGAPFARFAFSKRQEVLADAVRRLKGVPG
jgi:N-succinyldiaminopimelate aminotransferase